MKNLILGLILNCAFFCSNAQTGSESVINSTGGTYEKNNISFEWSVGELSLVNVMESPDGNCTLTHGYLQPLYAIKSRNRVAAIFEKDEIEILPNPATDKITVHYRLASEGSMKLLLFNDAGKAVYTNEVLNSGTDSYETIYIKNLPDGIYILNIKFNPSGLNQAHKNSSFKIIKIS